MAQRGLSLVPTRHDINVNRRMEQRDSRLTEMGCAICRYQLFLTRFVFLGSDVDLIDNLRDRAQGHSKLLFDRSSSRVFWFNQNNGTYQLIAEQVLLEFKHPRPYSNITVSGDPVFPLCQNCFFVLRYFMIDRNKNCSPSTAFSITSLQDLYAGLYNQYLHDHKTKFKDRTTCLGWDHQSLTGGQALTDDYLTKNPENWWMTTNPVQPIASLPSYILSHLEVAPYQTLDSNEPLPNPEGYSKPRRPRQGRPFLRLPPELVEEVASYLGFETVMALRSTCVQLANSISLDQRFWFRAFVSDRLFGFFFKFETVDAVREIRDKAYKLRKLPPRWDWMSLIKQLATYSSFANDGLFHNAPPGFRNRRRIWKILETIEQKESARTESRLQANEP